MRRASGTAGVGFAVIDVETTGFNAAGADRVIEIGLVLLGPDHTVQGEWSTLVNPGRDVGPTTVHHITARDVVEAPKFDQVAGDLASRLAGRVVVAHNAPFDIRFLVAEYGRLGVRVPLTNEGSICTMAAARTYLPGSQRNLSSCCRAAGVVQTVAHDALADAHAAAGLLGFYVARSVGHPFWEQMLTSAAMQPWPSVAVLGTPVVRRADVRQRAQTHYLARLVERLPQVESPPLDEYFALLDSVLMDRHLAHFEVESLIALAGELQLDQAAALSAHRFYLASLARIARQDGIVTAEERDDLTTVATLLDLAPGAVDEALADADTLTGAEIAAASFVLGQGDHVVFTGSTTTQPREWWERRASAAGLIVQPNVTKKTRFVVAADPDSQSGKAAKARVYGIPIITEDAFGRLVDGR